jgi:hypothetical protein
MIPGSDPRLKHEYVIYSAHWDHLGIDERLPGGRSKQIYHGALDNASGIAALLEIAKAYKALPKAPKRSMTSGRSSSSTKAIGALSPTRKPIFRIRSVAAVTVGVARADFSEQLLDHFAVAQARECQALVGQVSVLPRVMIGSTTRRSSLAFGTVVLMAS